MLPVPGSNNYQSLDNVDIKPCEYKLSLDGAARKRSP